MSINQAVHEARMAGWSLRSIGRDQAVLYVPAAPPSMVGHAVSAVLTLLTCGLWLIPWLIIIAVDPGGSEKTLIIREIDGKISRKVITV